MARTYVFLTKVETQHQLMEWHSYKDLSPISSFLDIHSDHQEWLPRLLNFIEARIGTWGKVFKIGSGVLDPECRSSQRIPPQFQTWEDRVGEKMTPHSRPDRLLDLWQDLLRRSSFQPQKSLVLQALQAKPKLLSSCFDVSWKPTNIGCNHARCDCQLLVTGKVHLLPFKFLQVDTFFSLEQRLQLLLDRIDLDCEVVGGRISFRVRPVRKKS